MASINGLSNIAATSIQNSGEFYLGNNLDPGTAGDTIVSNGANQAVSWGTHTGTINALTAGTNISYASGNPTFNGSIADTINATDNDTTYTAGDGLDLTGTVFSADLRAGSGLIITATEIDLSAIPNSALANSSITLGSTSVSLGATETTIEDLELDACQGITMDGANIDMDCNDIEQVEDITYCSGGFATTLKGNDYPSSETVCTYLDLTSATNLMPAAVSPFISTKIMETTLFRTISTVYAEYSTSFRTAFVAQSANVMVEFRAIIRCDNRLFYGGLYDYIAGAYHAGSRTRFNYNDESDQDYTTVTWWLDGLTPSSTYYITPYFRTHANYSYIYAGSGGSTDGYAPAIFRVIDGGSNVTVY